MDQNAHRQAPSIPSAGGCPDTVFRQIAAGSSVLLLGADAGLAQRLKRELHCTLDALVDAGDEAAGDEAAGLKQWCRSTVIAGGGGKPLHECFPDAVYDAVVSCGFLERQRNPEGVLDQVKGLLKPEGKAVFAVYNAAYAGVIAGLIAGEFKYSGAGALAAPNLRFFTRNSLTALLSSLGFAIEGFAAERLPLQSSEFAAVAASLGAPVRNYLASKPEADVYRLVATAVPPGAATAGGEGMEAGGEAGMAATGAATGPAVAPPPVLQGGVTAEVDVVVPAGLGIDEVRRCLDSVLANPQETPVEVVAVNDRAADEELSAYLAGLEAEGRITLAGAFDGIGFADAANIGMLLHPGRDTVLLHPDTVVSGDWLDRLRRAAASVPEAGTATPFTNDGMYCSYPRPMQPNPLPAGLDPGALDSLFRDNNSGEVVEIPAAAGFCTYIKRSCLELAGYLDSLHFADGYGADADFSLRAMLKGFKHLLCGEVFIYHQGACHQAADRGRIQTARMHLKERHPGFAAMVSEHAAADPALAVRRRVDLARLAGLASPRLLLISGRGGSASRRALDLAALLEPEREVFLLSPSGPGPEHPAVSVEWAGSGEDFTAAFPLPGAADDLSGFLKGLGINRIHFHHLAGLPEAVLRLPESLGVPYDFTVHDYFCICPRFLMVNVKGAYCGEPGLKGCYACLAEDPTPPYSSPAGADIRAWREYYGEFISGADRVIVPSRDALERLRHYLPEASLVHLPHPQMRRRREPGARLSEVKVLVPQELSHPGAVEFLKQCVSDAAARGLPLAFHVLGRRPPDIDAGLPIIFTGPYDEGQLSLLIEGVRADMVFFPGPGPEVCSYSLAAAMDSGLNIIAPGHGVYAEGLEGYANKHLLEPGSSPAEANDLFLTLAGSEEAATGHYGSR